MMENAIRVQKEYIVRIYDLKGSTHNRQTLVDNEDSSSNSVQ